MPMPYPWIERTFNFDFPVEKHPDLMERLRGTPIRVKYLVGDVPDDILTRSDGHGWSIQENIGHLLDLEDLFIGRLDDFMTGENQLRPADMTNRKTHEADHHAQPLQQILSAFTDVRLGFITRLEALAPSDFARTALHARLGAPMRLVDMMLFHAEHDDYHLARITQLKRTLQQ